MLASSPETGAGVTDRHLESGTAAVATGSTAGATRTGAGVTDRQLESSKIGRNSLRRSPSADTIGGRDRCQHASGFGVRSDPRKNTPGGGASASGTTDTGVMGFTRESPTELPTLWPAFQSATTLNVTNVVNLNVGGRVQHIQSSPKRPRISNRCGRRPRLQNRRGAPHIRNLTIQMFNSKCNISNQAPKDPAY